MSADQFDRLLGQWFADTAPRNGPPDLHDRAITLAREASARRRRFTWVARLLQWLRAQSAATVSLGQMATAIAIVVVAGVVIFASLRSGPPNGPGGPGGGPAMRDFLSYLDGYGQRFTPVDAPPDAADWAPGVQEFPAPGATVESAIYGRVTCFDPTRNCGHGGLVGPGESLDIWLVTFVDATAVAGECPLWATVDGHDGTFINGRGSPCN